MYPKGLSSAYASSFTSNATAVYCPKAKPSAVDCDNTDHENEKVKAD